MMQTDVEDMITAPRVRWSWDSGGVVPPAHRNVFGLTLRVVVGEGTDERVIVENVHFEPDGTVWFALGTKTDYGAQGDSAEEARDNFRAGFVATIRAHLREYGHVDRILACCGGLMDVVQKLRRELDDTRVRLCFAEARTDPLDYVAFDRAEVMARRLFGDAEAKRLFPGQPTAKVG